MEAAGVGPGQIAPVSAGSAQMGVQPSGQKRSAIVAIPQSYDDGLELVKRVQGARLLCAEPRIVRELK